MGMFDGVWFTVPFAAINTFKSVIQIVLEDGCAVQWHMVSKDNIFTTIDAVTTGTPPDVITEAVPPASVPTALAFASATVLVDTTIDINYSTTPGKK